MIDDYETLKKIGDTLGHYRYDIRDLEIVSKDNLTRYSNVLKDVDNYMKKIKIPYFFYFTQNICNLNVARAYNIVFEKMNELGIKAYYHPVDWYKSGFSKFYENNYSLIINPTDSHPSVIVTNYYAKEVLDILESDYNYIFKNSKKQDINKLELDINDTMPYLNVKKISKNTFEFEYPKTEIKRTTKSNFLYSYYGENYIKLNLEYPKNIKKVIVTGPNLKSANVYMDIINKELGYDLDSTALMVYKCPYILNNTYLVNKKITSINISAEFYDESNRNLKIEFIEE